MRITKKMTAFLLALLVVLSPVTALPLTTDGFATPELVLRTTTDKTEILPGDTVTITFSLDQTVSSQGFGVDYKYDREVFEWVDGEWSEEIDDEALLADVSESAAVFAAKKAFDISGVILTFTLKATSAAVCGETYEIKPTTSDLLPTVPESAEITVAHSFDNSCDETCNTCLQKVRDAKHVYDNPGDAECNVCSFVRELPTYVHAVHRGDTVTVSVSLSEQINIQGFGLDFLTAYDRNTFEWVRGDWSQTIKSRALLAQTNPGGEAVFAAEEAIAVSGEVFSFELKVKDDAAFGDYDVVVGIVKADGAKISTTSITVHECNATNKMDRDENTHWNVCATYACEYHVNEAAHEHTNACDTDCNVCGQTRVAPHDYTAIEHDAENHWRACSLCGTKDETSVKAHAFDNEDDSVCDVCGYTKYIPGDVDGNKTVNLNDAIHLLYHINFSQDYAVNQPVDFDGSGELDLNDAIYLLYHVNFSGDYPLH